MPINIYFYTSLAFKMLCKRRYARMRAGLDIRKMSFDQLSGIELEGRLLA